MTLPVLILVLAAVPEANAEDVLAAADQAAQAHEFERATELCLEIVAEDQIDDQSKQDAIQAALGYADIAYDETGAMDPLCQAYASLAEHGRDDVLALKPAIEQRLESIAGQSWRSTCFAEPDADREPADLAAPAETIPEHIPERPATTRENPLEPVSASLLAAPVDVDAPSPRSQPLMISGATLVSVGAASLAGMGATFIVWNHNRARIDAYRASVEAGRPKTDEMNAKVEQLEDSEIYLKPLAIATGALGAVTVITGAALLVAGHRRSRDVNLTPAFSRTFGGLTLTTRF